MDIQNNNNRSSFSGKIGYVLSAAGASVGLGNIWRFPYLAAKYGGGIFLLIYILLALTFGYTMIVAESAIGRMTRKSHFIKHCYKCSYKLIERLIFRKLNVIHISLDRVAVKIKLAAKCF